MMQTATRCTPVRSTCDSGETAKQMHDSRMIVFLFKPEIIRVVRLSKSQKAFMVCFKRKLIKLKDSLGGRT